MTNLNIRYPKSFPTARSLAKNAELATTQDYIFGLLTKNHLVVAFDGDDDEYEPTYFLGFLRSVTFTAKGVQFEVDTIGCDGNFFTAHYDNIKGVSDFDCPEVFFERDRRPTVGRFIGLVETDDGYEALVRVSPFDRFAAQHCKLDSMCFCSDIALGICGKEG